jgi:hypothetical protein
MVAQVIAIIVVLSCHYSSVAVLAIAVEVFIHGSGMDVKQ